MYRIMKVVIIVGIMSKYWKWIKNKQITKFKIIHNLSKFKFYNKETNNQKNNNNNSFRVKTIKTI